MKKKSGSKTSHSLTRQPGYLPNYMKSTSSADARREPQTSPHHSSLHRKDSTTSRQERTLVRKGGTSSGSLQVARATCSSTLQGKLCPYTYCSFNSHRVPPLKHFVSERRRARNVKLPKARPTGGGGEIVGRKEPAFDEICRFDEEGLSTHSLFTSNNWDSVKNDSSSQGNQTPSIGSDTTMFSNAMDGEQHNLKDIKHDKDEAESFNGGSTKNITNEPYPGDSLEPDSIEVNSRNKTEDKSSKQLNQAEAGAEKVKLRHQEVDARKNAEEWMVDYALRQAVTANKRKVAVLVEAFERANINMG